MPAQIESRWNFFLFFFYLGQTLWCIQSLVSTQTFWMALTVSVDSCMERERAESAFSGVTSSGRILEEGIWKWCSVCGIRHAFLFFNRWTSVYDYGSWDDLSEKYPWLTLWFNLWWEEMTENKLWQCEKYWPVDISFFVSFYQ